MKNKKMEIISFNMSNFSEWEKGVVNRNRHLFYKLLASPEVKRIVAVDFLPFTFKRALRNYGQNVIRRLKLKDQKLKSKTIYQDLTTRCVEVKGFSAELYIFSTIESIFSHKRVIQKLNRVLDKINSQSPSTQSPSIRVPRLVWSCFPMFKEHFQLKADLFVFDAVDNWLSHPSFKKQEEILKNNYQVISQKSDLIFTVSDNLIEFFKEQGRKENLFWVSNGVDYHHFNKIKPSLPSDLTSLKRPIIGYLGIIQQRIDINLLEYLAQNNPDKSFVLVGPLWPVYFRKLRRPAVEIKRLRQYKNIYFLGKKEYNQTPAYLNNFDVAFCPHILNEFVRSTNSLKILEYLASGVPIVTTPSSGVERFSHLVNIAEDYESFNKKINQVLSEDNLEKRQARKEKAQENDWENKIKEIIKIINKNIRT